MKICNATDIFRSFTRFVHRSTCMRVCMFTVSKHFATKSNLLALKKLEIILSFVYSGLTIAIDRSHTFFLCFFFRLFNLFSCIETTHSHAHYHDPFPVILLLSIDDALIKSI